MKRPSRRTAGYALVELLAVLLILGFLFAVGLPALAQISAQISLKTACVDLASMLNQVRAQAAFDGKDVGVKWQLTEDDLIYTVYADGNGNGILSDDIRRGIDPRVAGPVSLKKRYPGITFSFFPGFKGADPGGAPIGDLSDPIRFGRSDICTFSPMGRATPGSLYMSNGRDRQAVIRVSPMSAALQVYDWVPGARKWTKR